MCARVGVHAWGCLHAWVGAGSAGCKLQACGCVCRGAALARTCVVLVGRCVCAPWVHAGCEHTCACAQRGRRAPCMGVCAWNGCVNVLQRGFECMQRVCVHAMGVCVHAMGVHCTCACTHMFTAHIYPGERSPCTRRAVTCTHTHTCSSVHGCRGQACACVHVCTLLGSEIRVYVCLPGLGVCVLCAYL